MTDEDAFCISRFSGERMGRAADVSVSTSPFDADIAGCIDRYVRTY